MVNKSNRLLALIAIAAAQAVFAADDSNSEVDPHAPDFVLKSTAGPNLRLSEYRGEVVALAFWASWCGECRALLQNFEELHQTYSETGFQLLSISLDPQLSQARETAESLGLSFPVLHDAAGDVGELYEADDIPLVVFVDREGVPREVIEGFSRAEEDIYAVRLRELLRE